MQATDRFTRFFCVSINMHEATYIGTNNAFGTGGVGIIHFLIGHSTADGLKLDGKSAAKTAAGFHIVHFPEG